MKIQFTINKSLAVESVKSETYIKGSIDDASNQGATKLRFNETAGDISVHERKLSKDFVRGVERLKAVYVDFFIPNHKSVGDSAIGVTYSSTTGDASVTIDISRRFNGSLTDAIANYSQEYVEDYMSYQWWLVTGMQKQAEPYLGMMKDLEERIKKTFTISSPLESTAKFSSISGKMCNDDGSDFTGADKNTESNKEEEKI